VPMPDVNREQCLGGHAVVIVGYDYNKRTFKVRNSWGADWGDRGYAHFPFDYILNPDLADDFWILTRIS
jgi:C1A family cysteine protease